MDVYHRLANHFDKSGDQRQRDIFLTLAADTALSSGDIGQAELHFRRLLSKSPHHFLGGYGSFAEAQQITDVQMYLQDLRNRYPPNKAEILLNAQRREKAAKRPPSDSQQDLYQNWMQTAAEPPPNEPPQSEDDLPEHLQFPDDMPLDRTVAFVQRKQLAPKSPPKPKQPARQPDRNAPEMQRPKRADKPTPPPAQQYSPPPAQQYSPPPTPPGLQQPAYHPIAERSFPDEQSVADIPDDDDDSDIWKGEWLSALLFFLMILTGVALAIHTLVYPLF